MLYSGHLSTFSYEALKLRPKAIRRATQDSSSYCHAQFSDVRSSFWKHLVTHQSSHELLRSLRLYESEKLSDHCHLEERPELIYCSMDVLPAATTDSPPVGCCCRVVTPLPQNKRRPLHDGVLAYRPASKYCWLLFSHPSLVQYGATIVMSIHPETEDAAVFQKFKEDFNKVYSTPEEEAERFDIFVKRMQMLRRLNETHKEALFEINEFSDMSRDEISKIHDSIEPENE
uniref:Inhibitor_I29 domain-containing protein n=1 Tax=Steinernema glaseri TaxID=37863 RepID=A0A1I8AS01_9BILA